MVAYLDAWLTEADRNLTTLSVPVRTFTRFCPCVRNFHVASQRQFFFFNWPSFLLRPFFIVLRRGQPCQTIIFASGGDNRLSMSRCTKPNDNYVRTEFKDEMRGINQQHSFYHYAELAETSLILILLILDIYVRYFRVHPRNDISTAGPCPRTPLNMNYRLNLAQIEEWIRNFKKIL